MAKFQKKPSIYDALQFTGGVANAKTIVQGVSSLAPDVSVRYVPAASEYGLLDGAVNEFKNPERLRIESTSDNTTWYANLTDWVMVSRDGHVSVLTNEDFAAQYQTV